MLGVSCLVFMNYVLHYKLLDFCQPYIHHEFTCFDRFIVSQYSLGFQSLILSLHYNKRLMIIWGQCPFYYGIFPGCCVKVSVFICQKKIKAAGTAAFLLKL